MPKKPSIAALLLSLSAPLTKPNLLSGDSGVRGGRVTPSGSFVARTATLRLDTIGRSTGVCMQRVLVLGCAVRRWLHARLAMIAVCVVDVSMWAGACNKRAELQIFSVMILSGDRLPGGEASTEVPVSPLPSVSSHLTDNSSSCLRASAVAISAATVK